MQGSAADVLAQLYMNAMQQLQQAKETIDSLQAEVQRLSPSSEPKRDKKGNNRADNLRPTPAA